MLQIVSWEEKMTLLYFSMIYNVQKTTEQFHLSFAMFSLSKQFK